MKCKARITVTTVSRLHLQEREFNTLVFNSRPVAFRDPSRNSDIIEPELPEGMTGEETDFFEMLCRLLPGCKIPGKSEEYPQLIEPEEPYSDDTDTLDKEGERTTFSSIGDIAQSGNVVRITYQESGPDVFLENGKTLISFEDRNYLTMARNSGVWQTNLVFSTDKRRMLCNYPGYVPFEVTVATKSFKNTVTCEKGGVIDIRYEVEMKGAPLESCHITINVKPFEHWVEHFPKFDMIER